MSHQTTAYINGWKLLHPDFKIKCWSEDNFDIISAPLYVRQAYEKHKYAFVSDYVRLWALYQEGGIYFDTDVEVLKPFYKLLELPAFIGFEANKACTVETAVIGSQARLNWLLEIMNYYDNHSFITENGTLDMTANPSIYSHIFESKGLLPNGLQQIYNGELYIFPVDYFAPLSSTRVLKVTSNTYCIHHFDGTWKDYDLKDIILQYIFDKVIGRRIIDKLIQLKRHIANYLNKNK